MRSVRRASGRRHCRERNRADCSRVVETGAPSHVETARFSPPNQVTLGVRWSGDGSPWARSLVTGVKQPQPGIHPRPATASLVAAPRAPTLAGAASTDERSARTQRRKHGKETPVRVGILPMKSECVHTNLVGLLRQSATRRRPVVHGSWEGLCDLSVGHPRAGEADFFPHPGRFPFLQLIHFHRGVMS